MPISQPHPSSALSSAFQFLPQLPVDLLERVLLLVAADTNVYTLQSKLRSQSQSWSQSQSQCQVCGRLYRPLLPFMRAISAVLAVNKAWRHAVVGCIGAVDSNAFFRADDKELAWMSHWSVQKNNNKRQNNNNSNDDDNKDDQRANRCVTEEKEENEQELSDTPNVNQLMALLVVPKVSCLTFSLTPDALSALRALTPLHTASCMQVRIRTGVLASRMRLMTELQQLIKKFKRLKHVHLWLSPRDDHWECESFGHLWFIMESSAMELSHFGPMFGRHRLETFKYWGFGFSLDDFLCIDLRRSASSLKDIDLRQSYDTLLDREEQRVPFQNMPKLSMFTNVRRASLCLDYISTEFTVRSVQGLNQLHTLNVIARHFDLDAIQHLRSLRHLNIQCFSLTLEDVDEDWDWDQTLLSEDAADFVSDYMWTVLHLCRTGHNLNKSLSIQIVIMTQYGCHGDPHRMCAAVRKLSKKIGANIDLAMDDGTY